MIKCKQCDRITYTKEVEKNLRVCVKCQFHFPLTAWQRIEITLDQASFVEYDAELSSDDPLSFPGYPDKLKKQQEKTGMNEAVLTGEGTLMGHSVVIGVMDFQYFGGTMGSVVGEKITRAIEQATAKNVPLILFCASGGARMQEGLLSLMQMAKTSAALAEFDHRRG